MSQPPLRFFCLRDTSIRVPETKTSKPLVYSYSNTVTRALSTHSYPEMPVMEVAAGAIAAEEAVSTTIQGAAVAVAIAQPTGPLKATFSQIGSAPQSDSPDSLARSSHTVTFSDGSMYVHGGIVSKAKLAGPEMHILKLSNAAGASGSDYRSIPPIAEAESDPTPCARAGHTVVAVEQGEHQGKLVMYGGFSDVHSQTPLDDDGRVWIFDPESMFWSCVDFAADKPSPGRRANHAMVPYENAVILHGGMTASATAPKGELAPSDTWLYDLDSKSWTELPPLSSAQGWTAPTETSAAPIFAVSDHKLWTVTPASDGLSSNVHELDLKAWRATSTANPSDMAAGDESAPWLTLSIPTNPLTPGPSLASSAAVHAISTGLGRRYMLLMLGGNPQVEHNTTTSDTASAHSISTSASAQNSTLWTLQLPSSIRTPASAKDSTRDSLPGTSSHTLEWHPVDVVPKDEAGAGAAQQTWLTSARSGVQGVGGFLKSNVGGAASWMKRTAGAAGSKAYEIASHPGRTSAPTSPTDGAGAIEQEHDGPVLEDNETAATQGEVQHIEPVPEAEHPPATGADAKEATDTTASIVGTATETPAPPERTSTTDSATTGRSNRSDSTTTGVVSGKAHPGPRAHFGSTVLSTPTVGMGLGGASEHPAQVLMWGGVNGRGEREGDGWLVELRV